MDQEAQDSTRGCMQYTEFSQKEIHRWKVKEWRRILLLKETQKKARLAILIANDVNFRPRLIKKYKDHYILPKRKIHEGQITITL